MERGRPFASPFQHKEVLTLFILLFVICTLASSIGALVGAGGGVIIKPVLDMFGLMPVEAVSFCSGCTVLCMSIASLLRTRGSEVELKLRTSTPLAIGAVLGGFVGKLLLETVKNGHGSGILGGVQAVCLTLITAGVLAYVCAKDRLRSYHVDNPVSCVIIGLLLGVISSFLGIGGGTSNVAILFFFFSMDAHTAARNSIYIIVFSQLASIATAIITGSVPAFAPISLISMTAGGVAGALIGSAISKRLPNRGVESALKALLIVMVCIDGYNILKFFFL